MKLDAYTATIKDREYGYVAETLAMSLQGFICKGRPMRRYTSTLNIDVDNRTAAWIGLDAASGSVYVEGKGATSPALAKAIRVHFPEHSVPRLDVCEDYDEEGAFDALQAIVRASKGARVKAGYVALPDDVQDGKTWAVGARGGVGYVRLYEAGKHPDRLHLGRPNWARVELECRPHYARDKLAAAHMSPLDVWGFASWTHSVAEALTTCQVPRFEPEVRKYSFDKTTRYLAMTFRRHFEEMMSNGEDIGRTLQAVWEEEDALASKGRRS